MAPFLWLRILFPPFSDTGKPEEFGVDDEQIDRAIRSLEEERRTKKKNKISGKNSKTIVRLPSLQWFYALSLIFLLEWLLSGRAM